MKKSAAVIHRHSLLYAAVIKSQSYISFMIASDKCSTLKRGSFISAMKTTFNHRNAKYNSVHLDNPVAAVLEEM